ncbi:MAG: CopG family ribbon-helix-helix protein [Promethearchaeota archaeon]
MKIITINLPNAYVEALEKLTAELGIYPSRSEAIREALRLFVEKELDIAESIEKLNAIKVKRNRTLFF